MSDELQNLKNYIRELVNEVEEELEESTATGNVDGYQTPHAFSSKKHTDRRKKTSTQAGYTIVDGDVNNINEAMDTKTVYAKKAEIVLKGLVDAYNAIDGNDKSSTNAKKALKVRIDKQQKIVDKFNKNEAYKHPHQLRSNYPKSKMPDSFDIEFKDKIDADPLLSRKFFYIDGYDLKRQGSGGSLGTFLTLKKNDKVDSVIKMIKKKLVTGESVNELSLGTSKKIKELVKSFNNTRFGKFHKVTSGGDRIDFDFKATNFAKDGIQRELEKMFPKAHISFVKSGNDYKVGIFGKGVNEDTVPGGLTDNKSLEDIANKHKIDIDQLLPEYRKGIKVEMEHTSDPKIAAEISRDHLFEDPKYYTKLADMENESVNESMPRLIPNVGERDDFMLKKLLMKNTSVLDILGNKEKEFMKRDDVSVYGVSGKNYDFIFTDGKQEFEVAGYPTRKLKISLRNARPKIVDFYKKHLNEGKKPKPRTNRWLELKNDDTKPNRKLAMGLKELKYKLKEVESFIGWYNKISKMNELSPTSYWKRTNNHIYKIKERLINIAKTIKELEQ